MFNHGKLLFEVFLTYLEVKLAALMLKNVALDSAATALAWGKEAEAVIQLIAITSKMQIKKCS